MRVALQIACACNFGCGARKDEILWHLRSAHKLLQFECVVEQELQQKGVEATVPAALAATGTGSNSTYQYCMPVTASGKQSFNQRHAKE